jgi:DNA-binding transcriptional LysR family regulator
MGPELRHLRHFVAVAETLNYTRAAERLHLAPQAVSASIRQLETIVGARLLERTTRRVRLTDAGAAFLSDARDALVFTDRAVRAARRAARGETGILRVGFLSSTAHYVMPPVVRALAERHPDLVLVAEDLPVRDLVAGLRDGRLDAAVGRPPLIDDPELASETILREPVAAVLPSEHPLAERPRLRLSELAGEPWVLTERSSWPPWHELYDAEFRAAGFTPKVVQRGTSVQSLLALVAAGVGVTRLTLSARTLRSSGVRFVPLEDDEVEVVLMTRSGPRRPAVARFAEVLRDLAATTDMTQAG